MTEDKQKELLQDCKRLFQSTSMFGEQSLSRLVTYLAPLVQDFKSNPGVDFTDDIIPFDYTEVFRDGGEKLRRVSGMVSLVKYLRDAISHPELSLDFNEINSVTVRFCAMQGRGVLLSTPNGSLESKYADDVAYFHGKATIYHNRHLLRIVTEIEKELYK